MTDPNAWTHQEAAPPWEQEPAPAVWAGQPPQRAPQQQDPQEGPVGGQPSHGVAPAGASSWLPESPGTVEPSSINQMLWEYKVISATFGGKLETELNTWGAIGWEVVSIAGMGGTVTVTGNKIFVVLKRRSLRHEEAAAGATEYLQTLRNHYGPAVFDQLANKHGNELMMRGARALISSGKQANNPLGVLDQSCALMANGKHSKDDQVIEVVWYSAEGQPFPR